MGIFDDTKYDLTCSNFCLVCIGGRSSMNIMVSMDVSLVVPNMTRSALCPSALDTV